MEEFLNESLCMFFRVLSSPEEKSMTEKTFSQWTDVQPGEEIPFMFEEKGKARHRVCVTMISVVQLNTDISYIYHYQ